MLTDQWLSDISPRYVNWSMVEWYFT